MIDPSLHSEVECLVKYRGYIDRQLREIMRSRDLEKVALPADLHYDHMPSLSREVREKLSIVRPRTLAQASRIPGLTPAAISVLAVQVRRMAREALRGPATRRD
jgi:tRNA uridine 5-carboxymethylaminomethyl modification enzyme